MLSRTCVKKASLILFNLKPFVPSSVCLNCDGCCRFKEADSVWRPRVTPLEIDALKEKKLWQAVFAQEVSLKDNRLQTRCQHNEHLCAFFKSEDHTCQVYSNRPFECQLYPFLLVWRGESIFMAVHVLCPFVQEKMKEPLFTDYVAYLKELFVLPNVLSLLQKNLQMVGDYDQFAHELLYLFEVTFK